MVVACQRLASLSPYIKADMIDASLYPQVIEQYQIERVPMTIVNARLSHNANLRTEDIGARRLHTTIERVLEDISFDIESYVGKEVEISGEMVRERLGDLVENVDLARYIL